MGSSLVAQIVKNLPAMRETWVRSLGLTPPPDPLEEDVGTHSSVPARRIPMDRGAWRAGVRGVERLIQDSVPKRSTGSSVETGTDMRLSCRVKSEREKQMSCANTCMRNLGK